MAQHFENYEDGSVANLNDWSGDQVGSLATDMYGREAKIQAVGFAKRSYINRFDPAGTTPPFDQVGLFTLNDQFRRKGHLSVTYYNGSDWVGIAGGFIRGNLDITEATNFTSSATIATQSTTVGAADARWIRFFFDPATGAAKLKYWLEGAAEPAGWDLETTTTGWDLANRPGHLVLNHNGGAAHWYRYGLGTGGDPAPLVGPAQYFISADDYEVGADLSGVFGKHNAVEHALVEIAGVKYFEIGGTSTSGANGVWIKNPDNGEEFSEANSEFYSELRFDSHWRSKELVTRLGGSMLYGVTGGADAGTSGTRLLAMNGYQNATTLATGTVNVPTNNSLLAFHLNIEGDGVVFDWHRMDDPSVGEVLSAQSSAVRREAGGFAVRCNSGSPTYYRCFGIGTQGLPAPTAPVSAAPTTPANLTTTDITANSFRANWT